MDITINQTKNTTDFEKCARLMADSEPWITLKRDFNGCLAAFQGDYREVYIVKENNILVGFAIIQMVGTFKGYIQSILVVDEYKGKGIGSMMLEYCESRIFNESKNVFMCVSSFNQRAYKLYKKLGYETIGELKDFIVKGHSEILLRKSIP